MTDVYAQAFTIRPKPSVSLETVVTESIRGWIGPRWPLNTPWFSFAEPRAVTNPFGTYRWEPFVDGNRRLLDFVWQHPDVQRAEVSWTSRVTFLDDGRHGPRLDVKIANSGPPPGHPGAMLTTRPRLPFSLLQFADLECEGQALSSSPRMIAAHQVDDFVRYELLDPRRQHPVLLLSPSADGNYRLATDDLARSFASLGEACFLASQDAAWALTHALQNARLSVFHGGLRCYMPGFALSADPFRHPLLLGPAVGASASRLRLATWLALSTVGRYREPAGLSEIREERALLYVTQRQHLAAQYDTALSAAKERGDDKELAELYSSENQRLKQEIDGLEQDKRALAAKVDYYEHVLSQKGLPLAQTADTPLLEPDTVAEAVSIAEQFYANSLTFLPRAHSSAAESPYLKPAQVLQVFDALAAIADQARVGRIGKGLKAALSEHGFTYKGGIGKATSKALRAQYKISDGAHTYTCEEHIRLGATYDPEDCAVIYFSSEQLAAGRFVIGHVGIHLENMTST